MADRGYQSSWPDEQMFALPRPEVDSSELTKFKTRARTRHESFNGRLKFFGCLNQTFHHSWEKHQLVFEAVCVTIQYQMENGSPIFDI